MSEKEIRQNECADDCYKHIKDVLTYWCTDLDDFDKAVIVKCLINELQNDLVAYLCRMEMRKRGIEP